MATEVHETVKLIANTDIQSRHACNRGGRRVVDGRVNILIEHIISASDLVQVHDMETVFTTGAHFYAIEIDRVVCIEMKIDALQKEAGVNTIGGGHDPAGTRIIPRIKSKEARGTSYDLYGACMTIYSIRVRR